MRLNLQATIAALTFLVSVLLVCRETYAAKWTEFVREESSVYSDYRFVTEQRVDHDDEQPETFLQTSYLETFLIVYKSDREIARLEGWRWEIDEPPGRDLTGDGSIDVVFTEYSGGAHCCFTRHIIEMREPINIIKIYTGDGSFGFEELDGKLGFEIVTTHDLYTEWINGYVGAPFPRIMWRYLDGTYQPDPDLTRQPPLSDSELHRLIQKVRHGEWPDSKSYLPREFLSITLDLIYGGNLGQALEFIQAAWPPQKPGQAEFIAELLQCRMRDGWIWPMIAAMNGLPAERSARECRDREIGERKPWATSDD